MAWLMGRLERLAAEAGQMLALVDSRQDLHAQMEQLGRQINAAYRELEGGPVTERELRSLREREDRLQKQIESLRRQADLALDTIAVWHERVRQAVLEAAAAESKLLPVARELSGMRLPGGRGPHELRLAIVEAKSRVEAILGELRPTAPPAVTPAEPAPTRAPGVLLTVREAAEVLAVSPKTLYRMAQLGQAPHVRLGRNVRFRREDLEAWLERRSIRPRR
jgi:excisionase family DNA binding protein